MLYGCVPGRYVVRLCTYLAYRNHLVPSGYCTVVFFAGLPVFAVGDISLWYLCEVRLVGDKPIIIVIIL